MALNIAPDLYRVSLTLDSAAITANELLSPEETAAAVKTHGIVVFPALFDSETLFGLNEEFERLLDPASRDQRGFAVDLVDNLANVRVIRESLNTAEFPVTNNVFTASWMDEVAAAYFGAGNYRLNGEIFVSNIEETTGPQPDPPFALHFDKRQVLKFFIYLTDTDETNGAMRASPGSHYINREQRLSAMQNGKLKEIPNILPEPDVPSIPIVGPAGTMFVFETDMAHGASSVQPGKSRRTMRGHTHSRAMLDAMAQDTP